MRLCRRLSWKLKGKLSRKINKIFVFLIVIATIVLGEWYIRPWEGGNRLIKGFFLLAFAVSLEPIFLMDTMRKCSLDLASTWPISVILRILERIAGWLLDILSVPLEAIWRVIRTIGLVVSFVPRMIYKFCKFIKKCADRRKSRRMQEEYERYRHVYRDGEDDWESYSESEDTDDEERYSERDDGEDADDRNTYRESRNADSQRSQSNSQSSNSQSTNGQRSYSNSQSSSQRSYSNNQSSNSQKTQSESSNTNRQKTYSEGNNTNHQQTDHGSSTKSAYQIKYENALRMFGVRTPFTADQLHRRWRELMKSNHPDAGGSTVKAAQINENYQMLLKYASGK